MSPVPNPGEMVEGDCPEADEGQKFSWTFHNRDPPWPGLLAMDPRQLWAASAAGLDARASRFTRLCNFSTIMHLGIIASVMGFIWLFFWSQVTETQLCKAREEFPWNVHEPQKDRCARGTSELRFESHQDSCRPSASSLSFLTPAGLRPEPTA
jgi:hypothetical protein